MLQLPQYFLPQILRWFRFVIQIAEIAVYAVFILLSLFGGSKETAEPEKSGEEKTQSAEKAETSAESENAKPEDKKEE